MSYRRRVFRKKIVYYLAVTVSLMLFTVYLTLISFLNQGIGGITDAPSLKYLVFFTVFLIIINRYKAEVNYSEIEEIGKQEE